MEHINKKQKLLGLVIVISLIAVAKHYSDNIQQTKIKLIKGNPKITNGKILRILRDRFNKKIVYEYYVNNHKYQSSEGTNISVFKESKAINSYWPVIYCVDDPESHALLMSEDDFQIFNLKKPDTLIDLRNDG
jgi:hypothetical protein